MKLNFIIDQDYDFSVIYELLRQGKDPEVFAEKIDSNLLKKATSQEREEFVKALKDYTKERYKESFPFLEKTVTLYQESWDEINDNFFSLVEKITGFSWKHEEYFCVVSFFNRGISNWGGNRIIRGWGENPYLMRKITAHELLISHIFTIFEKEDFDKYRLTDNEKWKLAEISSFALCGLEEEMLKFWPWITENEKYPLNHNYPHIYKDQKNLKALYEKKESFVSFLKESIEIMEREED